jgi:hypothetical protein
MKFLYALPMAAAWLFACGFAEAHGPQIQLTGDTGQIVTRRVIPNQPYIPLQPETRIYVIPVKESGGTWFVKPPTASTSGPGIAIGWGYDEGDPNSHPFQNGSYTVKFTDGLLKWNGSSFGDAGDTQLRVNKGATTATTSDMGPFASLTWSIATVHTEKEDAHSGLTYRFLGDGSSQTSDLPNGIYLLSLALAHGTLTDAAPFYYVLPKGEPLGDAVLAAHSLAGLHGISAGAIQVVPEPTSAALVLSGMAVLLWRRKS